MGKPKKLDLSLEQLKEIANSINENTIANRTRSKEDKIPTDKFIRKFNISRKDFSETIKDTCITYDRRTFLYNTETEENINVLNEINNNDLSSNEINNIKIIESIDNTDIEEDRNKKVTPSNTEVTPSKNNKSNTKVTPSNTIDIIKLLEEQLPEVLEIVKAYNQNKEIEIKKDLIIDQELLNGESITRSFKTYKKVLDDFSYFCKDRKETQKDLLAMALIEFMDRYK